MNQDHRFEFLDTRLAPTFQSPSELGHVIARARQQRAEATAAMIGAAFRGMARALRPPLAQVVRWERRRLYRELDAYNDRELEEIGLRRADIPVIARGQPVFRRAA